MKIYSSLSQLIGRTPLLRAEKYARENGLGAEILIKIESFNPAGSIKDRVALNMIDRAEQAGILKEGATIIEPTSGNTGIGMCAIAAARGYRAIIVMPDTMSVERQTLMRAYGAEVVLTDGKLGMAGAVSHAEKLRSEIPGAFIPGQFENPSNPEAHYLTTGPEIWDDTDGNVDIFVSSVGNRRHHNWHRQVFKEEKTRHKSRGRRAGFVPSAV